MARPSPQAVVIACALAAGGAFASAVPSCAQQRIVDAGFWFEPVSFDSPKLGGALTADDVNRMNAIANAELTRAFTGMRIRFSDRRDATYRVRVVQQLRDLRFRRYVEIAGSSRAVSGFGGAGAVSLDMLANSALAYAPADADRDALVAAIGRGVGRAAVHEFVHQLLPRAPIHDSTDIASYEYLSAARPEQYYGDMHWDLAWPLLNERLGTPAPAGR